MSLMKDTILLIIVLGSIFFLGCSNSPTDCGIVRGESNGQAVMQQYKCIDNAKSTCSLSRAETTVLIDGRELLHSTMHTALAAPGICAIVSETTMDGNTTSHRICRAGDKFQDSTGCPD